MEPGVTAERPLDDCGEAQPSSVLAKADLLLAAFATGPTTMGLTELSRRSGVPKASAHRLAVELVGLGLLARTTQGYQLGWRMFELGQLVPGPANLLSVARPALMDLRSLTRAVVHLAVPQGDDCVYLERFAGRRENLRLAAVGQRVPMHATASGRLFLAYAEDEAPVDLDPDVLRAFGVRRYDEVSERMALIRARRASEENQQCVEGFKTIAVPVFYPGGERVMAAISITTPADRRDGQQILHALWAAASDITRSFERSSSGTARRHRMVG
jgi:DNA-binding IclR family transcriptional regulator